MVRVGIIGGSGLDDPDIIEQKETISVNTRFGKPSCALTTGKIKGVEVAILARHGKSHEIMPTNVPYRANIGALKKIGCTHILATSSSGSLREKIEPGHFVLPDQFIDRTTKRASTFYDKDEVCHIPMAEPFCKYLRDLISKQCKKLGLSYHTGTVITIEGPRFSTKAESHLFRSWGADVINMTTVPEVVLAREAGICYQVIAMSTDYDCWKQDSSVTIDEVLDTAKKNAENVKKLLLSTIPKIKLNECVCRTAIENAII